MLLEEEVTAVCDEAVCVASAADVEAALARMAQQLQGLQLDAPVLLLCVMSGGLMVAAELLKRLPMPMRLDYIHASRYRDATEGSTLTWEATPSQPMVGATVIVVDDIFDEGVTLAAVVDFCRGRGALKVVTAVLVDKQHARKQGDVEPDVVGLSLPDHYLFGFGMDYKGYLRNRAGIYAVRDRGR